MTLMHLHEHRPPRYAISQRIVLVHPDGSESSATIVNISQRGFRLKVTEILAVGEHVTFRNMVGDVPAQIQWASGNDVGGVFLQPKDD